jgi:hypothetical protein
LVFQIKSLGSGFPLADPLTRAAAALPRLLPLKELAEEGVALVRRRLHAGYVFLLQEGREISSRCGRL